MCTVSSVCTLKTNRSTKVKKTIWNPEAVFGVGAAKLYEDWSLTGRRYDLSPYLKYEYYELSAFYHDLPDIKGIDFDKMAMFIMQYMGQE